MNNKDMIDAWIKAQHDLGIEVKTKLTLRLKTGTKDFIFIQDFGGPKGTIVTSINDTKDFKELQKFGFYCSALGESYSTYNRMLFIDTLNDWGFFGELNKKPTWYKGQP